ncbi:MAG: hypothetical protein KAR55_03615 [Thermoplasmatales archaeon]|nr:hypothetical protein [Thermoplasmatales archaeon]
MEKTTKIVVALVAIVIITIIILLMFLLGYISVSDIIGEQAESMGEDALEDASTGLSVDSISGYTNEEKNKIEYLAISIKPIAGSKEIDLTECGFSATHDTVLMLLLNESLVEKSSQPFNNGVIDKLTSTNFGVMVINDQDDSITRSFTMNSGDNVMILVDLVKILENEGLSTSGSISCMLSPQNGKKTSFDATAPAVFSNRVIELSY